MMIIESLCAMLHNMASHKEGYNKMIISLLTRYYVNCFEQYQGKFLNFERDLKLYNFDFILYSD